MRLKAKVGIATATCALAVAGPAVAQACNGKGSQQSQDTGQHAGQAGGNRGNHHQFVGFGRHGRSFGRSVFGVLVTWTATQTGTNTYSGTITVTKPNFKAHWARNGSSTQPTSTTQPTQVTYTFTNAKVFFGQGANPPAAGDLVKIIGARLNHCKSSTSTGSSTTTSTTSTTPTTSTGNVRAIFIAAPPSSSAPSSSSQS